MKKLKILVLGYIVRGPLAGMTWHHLQYCLGLRQLGHDVFFLEDSGDTEYSCYDPERDTTDSNPAYGLRYAASVFETHGMKDQWAYFDKPTNTWHGNDAAIAKRKIAEADVLINVSISNPVRPWLERVPVKILIDTDPVFTQIRNLTDPVRRQLCNAHDYYFSFGENFGKDFCSIPDDGYRWLPTRQPVYLEAWKIKFCDALGWTTVMQWESYSERVFAGEIYGMKSMSFEKYYDFPVRNNKEVFHLAIGAGPKNFLNTNGWNVMNSLEVSRTPDTYNKFIEDSKGEFSVAKHGYAVTNSGWFSERSACYLASGKPVVVQDTGFSDFLPVGKGLFAFDSIETAEEKIKEACTNYSQHCKWAREIAEEFFASDKVLIHLLNRIT